MWVITTAAFPLTLLNDTRRARLELPITQRG